MIQHSSLHALLQSEAFNPIDRHFGNLVRRLSDKDCPALVLAAALVSRRLADGHPCLALEEVADRPFPETAPHNPAPIQCPPRAEWEQLLRETPLVGRPGEE